jgi:hypothetical protein
LYNVHRFRGSGFNEVLARERGITFEEIVQRIESGAKVIEADHPNRRSIRIKRYL